MVIMIFIALAMMMVMVIHWVHRGGKDWSAASSIKRRLKATFFSRQSTLPFSNNLLIVSQELRDKNEKCPSTFWSVVRIDSTEKSRICKIIRNYRKLDASFPSHGNKSLKEKMEGNFHWPKISNLWKDNKRVLYSKRMIER